MRKIMGILLTSIVGFQTSARLKSSVTVQTGINGKPKIWGRNLVGAKVLSPDRLPLKEFLNDLPTTKRRCALLYSLKRTSLTAVNGNLEQCRRILHLQDTRIQGSKLITIKPCHS